MELEPQSAHNCHDLGAVVVPGSGEEVGVVGWIEVHCLLSLVPSLAGPEAAVALCQRALDAGLIARALGRAEEEGRGWE